MTNTITQPIITFFIGNGGFGGAGGASITSAFWTGVLDAFLEAGFQEMPRWSDSRPIVRCRV